MDEINIGVERAIERDVKRCRYAVVRCDRTHGADGFYSVGMCASFGRPELLLFGLPAEQALDLMYAVAWRYAKGERFDDGVVVENLLPLRVTMKHVDIATTARWAPYALSFCRARTLVPAFTQLVIADASGRFPWDAAYAGRTGAARPWPSEDHVYALPDAAVLAALTARGAGIAMSA